MRPFFIKYLKSIIILTAVLAIISLATMFWQPQLVGLQTLYILIFFFLFNIATHYVLIRITIHKMNRFTSYYMASTLFKLMVYFGVILWQAFNNRSEAINFIVTFFIFYLIFTFFEVLSLQTFARKVK